MTEITELVRKGVYSCYTCKLSK